MDKEKIKIKNGKMKGWAYRFYYKGKDITDLWMDFFSGLTMEEESKCEELFLKRYRKELTPPLN